MSLDGSRAGNSIKVGDGSEGSELKLFMVVFVVVGGGGVRVRWILGFGGVDCLRPLITSSSAKDSSVIRCIDRGGEFAGGKDLVALCHYDSM